MTLEQHENSVLNNNSCHGILIHTHFRDCFHVQKRLSSLYSLRDKEHLCLSTHVADNGRLM